MWSRPSASATGGTAQRLSALRPVGAGHFVKMVHNGIEYGIMQAYGEGFDIMKNANSKKLPANIRYNLDLGEIAEALASRQRGQLVAARSERHRARRRSGSPSYTGFVQDSGEGRWTILAALENLSRPKC